MKNFKNKLLIMPSSEKMIVDTLELCDGYIIGINNFSVNIPLIINIEQITIMLSKYKDKKIYLSLNKNFKNADLGALKKILVEISKLNIAGVIFYDIALFNINKKNNLKINLIWGQEHFTTNHRTINFWNDLGVKGTLLSSEITVEEINEITNNTNSMLMITIFGYLPMFNSFRHLLKNYLDTFNIPSNSNYYYIEDKDNYYPLIDDKDGTTVYSSNILNGLLEYWNLKNSKISFFILNSYKIEDNKFLEVLNYFNQTKNEKLVDKIDLLFNNTDRGFFYKETVYKVKNNE